MNNRNIKMSLKPNKPERKKPRAMPVETIVTRFKSKQKLLEKEQGNTTNNGKKQKTTKKIASNEKKVIKQIKKIDSAEQNEIYANKFKRKIVNKKIMLVPRHSYKVIGRIKGCNKRKLRIPQKEISFPVQRHFLNASNELKNKQTDISIIDMIKIIEDSQSLDEEDLLEILTCPSPVWWEDPPDGYIEEAIFSRPQQKFEQKSIKTQILEEQIRQKQKEIEKKAKEDLSSLKLDMKIDNNIQNHDKTFVKKRSKLEIILDNIKSKTNKENKLEMNVIRKTESSDNSVTVNANSAILLTNNVDSSAKLKKNIQKTKNKKRKIIKTKQKTKLKLKNKKKKLVKNSKKKRNSDSFKLSDIEDDILEHLENMDIPIEHKNETNLDLNKDIEKETKGKEIKEKETKEVEIEIKDMEEKEIKEVEIEIKDMEEKEIKEVEIEIKDMEEKEIKEKQTKEKETKENDVIRRISIESNKSDKQIDEVEYLDMSVFDEIIKNKTDYTKHSQFNEVSNSKDDDVEYVTVYKIINNETSNDINELKIMLPVERKNDKLKDGGKINDYYKHCKKVNVDNDMKSEKNDEISILTSKNESKASEKSILISEIDSIRYCFVCSSIFDKETCDYCEKKNTKKKICAIFCDFCGLKVNSKHEMIKHLESHQVIV